MDSNKDEAERCIEIGIQCLASGNLAKAERFLLKAERLFPSEKAKKILEALKNMPKNSGKREASPKETNGTAKQPRSEPTLNVDFTIEQLEAVKRVKGCKTHYDVLGVVKTATDSDIKKAYKKLALMLHPDKNKAPGAVEAFKTVGAAAAILTDVEKRKNYDLFGSNDRNGRVRHEHARHEQPDVSAEELFNMFFGGGFAQSNMYMRQQRRRQQAREEPDDQNLTGRIINLFPLLILIVLSMMSSMFISDPIYSLSPSHKYPVHRETAKLKISYYVKGNFISEYQGSVARLEESVENEHINHLRQSCARESSYKEALINRARIMNNRNELDNARKIELTFCKKYEELRRR